MPSSKSANHSSAPADADSLPSDQRSRAASVSSTSTAVGKGPAGPSNVTTIERKLTKEEKEYLKTRVSEYHALQATLASKGGGPRGLKTVKGAKKKWVKDNIWDDFTTRFLADGTANRSFILKEILVWFNNNRDKRLGGGKGGQSTKSSIVAATASSKRPPATTAQRVFSTEQRETINQGVAEKRSQEGLSVHHNLPVFNRLSKEMFDELPEEERAKYKEKAAAHNAILREKPGRDEIFGKQKDIIGDTIRTLHGLIGFDWGQYGDAAFFVLAFRDENGKMTTFNCSVTGKPIDNQDSASFLNEFPGNYNDDLRKPFKKWAARQMPELPSEAVPTNAKEDVKSMHAVLYNNNGSPRLPDIDLENITPVNMRLLLTDYIRLTWEFSLSSHLSLDHTPPPPWDILHDAEKRATIMKVHPSLSGISTLDPARMALGELGGTLLLFLRLQSASETVLEFDVSSKMVSDIVSSAPDHNDHDIVEVPDPDPAPSSAGSKTKGQRKSASKTAPSSNIPDFSPPSPQVSKPRGPVTRPASSRPSRAGEPSRTSDCAAVGSDNTDAGNTGSLLPEEVVKAALQVVFAAGVKDTSGMPAAMSPAAEISPLHRKRPAEVISSLEGPMPDPVGDAEKRGKRLKRVRVEVNEANLLEDQSPKTTGKKSRIASKKASLAQSGLPLVDPNAIEGSSESTKASEKVVMTKPQLVRTRESKRLHKEGYKNHFVNVRKANEGT